MVPFNAAVWRLCINDYDSKIIDILTEVKKKKFDLNINLINLLILKHKFNNNKCYS